MIKKKLLITFLAGALATSMVFPSFAAIYQFNTGSTEIIQDGDVRWASGHVRKYPGWAWVNGYCYYYTDYLGGNMLKNCVTPDGYTVDAEGRWTENGIAQSNGYGGFVIGTDQLYAGKSDDQRWEVMKSLYENLFANYIVGDEHYLAMSSAYGLVRGDVVKEGFSRYSVIHNPADDYSKYVEIVITNKWNDCSDEYAVYRNEVMEKAIKIICGDHVGQELFNDLKIAADPAEGPRREIVVFDENGQLIFIDSNHVKTKIIEKSSDGINFNKFDMNKWKNKKTDYGKTIEIIPGNHLEDWHIIIKK